MGKKAVVSFGDRYSKFTVISEIDPYIKKNGDRDRKVRCLCDCGNTKDVLLRSLRSGGTTSCGCAQKEAVSLLMKTHGLSKTRQYQIWENVVARCTNPNSPSYLNYGGKGVTLCDDWKIFSNFWEDMQDTYQENLTLDRIDVKGGYSKDNCRWVDSSVQGYNKDIQMKSSTGCCGVYEYNSKNSPYYAAIGKDGVTHILGRFATLEEAIVVRKQAEIEFYGFQKFIGGGIG